MWNNLKWHIAGEMGKLERGGTYISAHKDLLAHMSIMEASEYERVIAGRCGLCESDKNDGRKEPEKRQKADRKPEPKEILRKVFGNDYTDSLVDLEKKLNEKRKKICCG